MYWLEVKFIYFLAMQAHKVSKNLIGTFALEHSLHSHLQLFPQSLTAACLPPPLPSPNQHHMAMLYIKCAHQLIYCIRRLRLQLFRSVIRLHLILFGQKCQTLKRKGSVRVFLGVQAWLDFLDSFSFTFGNPDIWPFECLQESPFSCFNWSCTGAMQIGSWQIPLWMGNKWKISNDSRTLIWKYNFPSHFITPLRFFSEQRQSKDLSVKLKV